MNVNSTFNACFVAYQQSELSVREFSCTCMCDWPSQLNCLSSSVGKSYLSRMRRCGWSDSHLRQFDLGELCFVVYASGSLSILYHVYIH